MDWFLKEAVRRINHPNALPALASIFVAFAIPVIYLAFRQVWDRVSSPKAADADSESFFEDEHGEKQRFGSIYEPASLTLSVVVPAYNEEKRIKVMMDSMLEVLAKESKKDKSFTWEVLVVNDGSKDGTADLVQSAYVAKLGADRFRLLRLARNNGKGGAVRKGMVRARGRYLLMADADGATQASDLSRLLAEVKDVEGPGGLGIAIGSRAHMENEAGAKASRSPLRKVLMWGFHTFINIMLGGSTIQDTQCGFKLFTRRAAAALFPVQNIDRWAFDVELVHLATHHHIPMVEVPVHWEEIDGSKIDIVSDSLKMARDIIAIRLAYGLGKWSYTAPGAPAVGGGADDAPKSSKSAKSGKASSSGGSRKNK